MRILTIILASFAAIGFCSAQANNTTPAIDFSKIPPCGLLCLANTAPKAGCGLTDIQCICTSKKMTDLNMACVLANCTLNEAFSLVKQQADLCQYPNESTAAEARSVVVIFGIVTKFVIPLRLALRLYAQGMLGWDDWLILLAFFVDASAFYAAMKILSLGLGNHIWNVNPLNIEPLLVWFYVVLALYVASNGIIKLSVLSFYMRIFTVSHRFTILCWIMFVFCATTMVAFLFVTLFQCVPVSNSWKLVPQDGFCINYSAATWSHSAINVFQDALVLILPITQVIALQMSLRKKIGVIMIFVLGGFVVVASIIRMTTLHDFGRTADPTWTNEKTFMWSSIELGVGLICASIPGIYSGLRFAWPGFRNFTRRHISMKGSKPSNESQDSHRKQPSTSGIPVHVKYKKTTPDTTLSTMASESYEMQTKNKQAKIETDVEATAGTERLGTDSGPARRPGKPWRPLINLNKPQPPLPREGIETSTTVTIIRGPRSATFDDGRYH